MQYSEWELDFLLGAIHIWRQHIFGAFCPPSPLSAFVRLWTLPLGNDVRPWHTPPLLQTNFYEILQKWLHSLWIPLKAQIFCFTHFVLIYLYFKYKFKGWVFLFMHLFRLQRNILFCWCHHWSNPPSPHVRFCQHFTNPPSPLGCWRHMWMAPSNKLI